VAQPEKKKPTTRTANRVFIFLVWGIRTGLSSKAGSKNTSGDGAGVCGN